MHVYFHVIQCQDIYFLCKIMYMRHFIYPGAPTAVDAKWEDICHDASIDAVTKDSDGGILIFKGSYN